MGWWGRGEEGTHGERLHARTRSCTRARMRARPPTRMHACMHARTCFVVLCAHAHMRWGCGTRQRGRCDGIAVEALRLMKHWLPKAVNDGSNIEVPLRSVACLSAGLRECACACVCELAWPPKSRRRWKRGSKTIIYAHAHTCRPHTCHRSTSVRLCTHACAYTCRRVSTCSQHRQWRPSLSRRQHNCYYN